MIESYNLIFQRFIEYAIDKCRFKNVVLFCSTVYQNIFEELFFYTGIGISFGFIV